MLLPSPRVSRFSLDPNDSDSSLTSLEDNDIQGNINDKSKEAATKKAKRSTEGCHCSDIVPSIWQEKVMSTKTTSAVTAVQLLIQSRQFDGICYRHLHALGSKLSLQTNKLDAPMLQTRLNKVYDRCGDLWDLKTNSTTYTWFRKANRPPRAIDTLGLYRFFHHAPPPFQPDFLQWQSAEDNWQPIVVTTPHHQPYLKNNGSNIPQLDQACISAMLAEWDERGNINLKKLFAWWWDLKIDGSPETCIANMLDLEFELYRHHLRNPKDHNGWLRNMIYSLVQQVMRQDPFYYRHYVLLRPDHEWRLISYPYYTSMDQRQRG